jgi:magnesium-transporting ATPase (P-type)
MLCKRKLKLSTRQKKLCDWHNMMAHAWADLWVNVSCSEAEAVELQGANWGRCPHQHFPEIMWSVSRRWEQQTNNQINKQTNKQTSKQANCRSFTLHKYIKRQQINKINSEQNTRKNCSTVATFLFQQTTYYYLLLLLLLLLSLQVNKQEWNSIIIIIIIIITIIVVIMSRDSVVGITTGYGLDDRGFGVRVLVGSRIFSSPRRPDRLFGSLNLLPNGYWGLFPRG